MNSQWSFRLRRAFFARRSGEELDRVYYNILEQQFQLKHIGNLSLFEQDQMIAEDRAWWIRRLRQHEEQKQEAHKQQMSNVPRPSSRPRHR